MNREYHEWLDKWKEHDLEISAMAPSQCRRCKLSGSDLNHYKCETRDELDSRQRVRDAVDNFRNNRT